MGTDSGILRVKAAIAGVIGALTALWGWFGWLVIVWAGLMLADWLVGSLVAAKEGRWSSAKMREGAWHKGGMVLVVCIALLADHLIGTVLGNLPGVALPFSYSVLMGPLVVVWYIIGELGSLAEHAVSMGAAVPAWLMAMLEVGKHAVDTAGEQITSGNESQTPPRA